MEKTLAPPKAPAPASSRPKHPGHRGPRGGARWDWWDWWLERKTRWVRDPRPQMDAGIFRALAAGTGLPAIHQKSTFAFHSVRDGAERFLGIFFGRDTPSAEIYT